MKKIFQIVSAVVLVSLSLAPIFAEDTNTNRSTDLKQGFSMGGGTIFDSNKSGGTMEISFPFLVTESLFIRNAFAISGFGLSNGGLITLSDKIKLGGLGMNNTASYCFVQGGVGTVRTDEQELFTLPLFIDVCGGGGFEIYVTDRNSVNIEAGGGVSIHDVNIDGFAHIGIIYKYYFN